MIKNDRQYRITRAQAERFRGSIDAETASVDSFGQSRLERAQRIAMASQLEELEEQLREYEHLKSGAVRVFKVDRLDQLPTALIKARIASGFTQRDLAARLGLHEQQVQQYEASDFSTASFTRLKQIAEAVGVVVSNDVFLPLDLTGQGLIKRLQGIGFDRSFVESRLVPLGSRGRLDQSPNAGEVLHAASFAAQALGMKLSTLLTEQSPGVDYSALATVRHKLTKRADGQKVSLYTVYAHHLALLALQATAHVEHRPVPEDTDELHDDVIRRYGTLSFQAALSYVWNQLGIPVLPLRLHGGFHGATWRVHGRDVIVLNPSQLFPAFWLNDLLHEVGHASQEPTETERTVLDIDPTWESTDDSPDERDARHFAIDTTFRSRSEELRKACEVEAGHVEGLKRAVELIATREHVPADSLALHMAAVLKKDSWWGAAMNLQQRDVDAFQMARAAFLEHANLGRLGPEDREIVLLALQGEEGE